MSRQRNAPEGFLLKSAKEIKRPEFSVLMSVYSKETPQNLDESLSSIERQTVQPKEVVIVLDGPVSDRLHGVINDHTHFWKTPIRVVYLEKNLGLGSALKEGAKHIKQPWIARMDSDDICVPRRFEIQTDYIVQHPTIDVFGGQIDEFSHSTKNLIGKREVPVDSSKLLRFAKYRSPLNHPTVFIRRSALDLVGGYRDRPRMEDYDLWIRLIVQGFHMGNINQVLVHMRADGGLVKRRGGLKYLRNYFKLRHGFVKLGFLKIHEAFLGDLIMAFSVFIGSNVRAKIYRIFLRKAGD